MSLILGVLIIGGAIVATIRRVDVRLALLLAALALGGLAGLRDLGAAFTSAAAPADLVHAFVAKPMSIIQTFLGTLVAENFVVPICCAMGFARVLRLTECDQHLVQLLVSPLRRLRPLLIPGAVLVGFLVNIPVISQTSTAVCVGSVLVPLLLAARISPVTTGAALLLGSSIGGELLNPGAPEIGTISALSGTSGTMIVSRILPLNVLQLLTAGLAFWGMSLRCEARYHAEQTPTPGGEAPSFPVNYFKALVPLLPLLFLFLAGPPLHVFQVPRDWLVSTETARFYGSRLVGSAMLLGASLAVLSTPSTARESARAFFDGAGYAFTSIIAVIVAATCFGKGVELIGLADLLGQLIVAIPNLLIPTAGGIPLSFAFLSGSGMASTQSLFRFFAAPSLQLGIDAALVGAVVSLGSAAGRTMSPVATVTIMCATLSGTDPFALVKRVTLPLLLSMALVVLVAMVLVKR